MGNDEMTDALKIPQVDTIYVNVFSLQKPYGGMYYLNEKEAGGCVKFVRAALTKTVDENTSDGYHTFNELYEHRHSLFIALTKAYKNCSWKSKFHSDGSMFDGWFIAGIATTYGQATYHIPMRLWDEFDIDELPCAPPWDGHTADDVIKRIKTLTQPKADVGGLKTECCNLVNPAPPENEEQLRRSLLKIGTVCCVIDHIAAQGYIGGAVDTSWIDGDLQNEICGIITEYGVEDIYTATDEILLAVQNKAAPKKDD